jgi:hypothetical protein
MIVNYASGIVNKLKALLTDDARVVIYNLCVFIVQATDVSKASFTLLKFATKTQTKMQHYLYLAWC